jgi:hypothetical protein
MFIEILCHNLDFIKDESGICSLLMLLGNYGDQYSDAPYVVEEFIEENENISTEVKVHLLHCCLKLFFHYPAVSQHLLGRVFEICSEDEDECLQNMLVMIQCITEILLKVVLNTNQTKPSFTHIVYMALYLSFKYCKS